MEVISDLGTLLHTQLQLAYVQLDSILFLFQFFSEDFTSYTFLPFLSSWIQTSFLPFLLHLSYLITMGFGATCHLYDLGTLCLFYISTVLQEIN